MTAEADTRDSMAIVSRERVHDGPLPVDRVHAQEIRATSAATGAGAGGPDVETIDIIQEIAVAADSAAVLIHDHVGDRIWLTRQFCSAVLEADARWRPWGEPPNGAIARLPRTSIAPGEPPETAARRALAAASPGTEARSDADTGTGALERIALFYPSPATATERVHLFHAVVAARPDAQALPTPGQTEGGAVLAAEAFIDAGRRGLIDDAATLIAAQWLAACRRA